MTAKAKRPQDSALVGILTVMGFALFEAGQYFARPTLSELSSMQDVIALAAQAVGMLAIAMLIGATPYAFSSSAPASAGSSRTRPSTLWMAVSITGAACCIIHQVIVLTTSELSGLVPAYLGPALSGIAFACFYFMWIALFSRMRMPRGILLMLVSLVLGMAVSLVIRTIGDPVAWFAGGFILLDSSTVLLLILVLSPRLCPRPLRSSSAVDPSADASPEVAEARRSDWRRVYVPAALGAGLFALLLGLTTQIHNLTQSVSQLPDYLSFIVSIGLLVALGLWVGFSRRDLHIENLFLITVPAIALVMILVPLIWAGVSDIADALVKTFYNLYIAAFWVFLIQNQPDDFRQADLILARGLLILFGADLVGSILGLVLFSVTSLDMTVITAVCLGVLWVCMLVAIVVLKAGRPASKDAGDKPDLPPEVVYVDRMERQVAQFSDAHGFSDREREVTLLFCQGRSASRITEELFLSENTVKTHLQNIYTKAGVHSRQELLDLIAKIDITS